MRKVLPFLGASLSILAVGLAATPSNAQGKLFQDVPQSHWAYEAVSSLQSKDILKGYPDGYFRGKRPLTRYEFAVALDRALKSLPAAAAGTPGPKGDTGATGAQGEKGEKGDTGAPGVTPDELARFKALADEFAAELKQIGANVKDINSRLDALSKDVADVKNQLSKLPKIGGDFFAGFRSDRSRQAFYDYSGAPRPGSNSNFQDVQVLHDFHLTVAANLNGGTKFKGDIVASNYLNYRADGAGTGIALGGPSTANTGNLNDQFNVYQAELDIPIGAFGSNTSLAVGRFKNQITPLTYYRPDTDAYFDLPWYDDGNYVEDGFKLESKFGSAKTQIFGGTYNNLGSTNGTVLNAPLVGANYGPFNPAGKPTGLALANQQLIPQESLGLHVGLPLFKFGELGFTAIDFNSASNSPATLPALGNFNNVTVYGVNLKLNPIGRFTVAGEVAKSVTQVGLGTSADNNINEDNNAAVLTVGYNSGPVKATIGYQYIDPRFAAPGYWNKIGNWYNPTNLQGGYARVNYTFTKALVGYIGGDYYGGARNRPFVGGLTTNSHVSRATAGLKYNVNKYFNVSAAYEGVIYDLASSVSASGVNAKPVEQYLTFGAGLNLSSNTVLKLGYQIINAQDVNGGFGNVTATGAGTGHDSNASVLTTQLAVHF